MLVRQFVFIGLKNRTIWSGAGSRGSTFNFKIAHNFSTNETSTPRICVVGAGPAGFYASQYILKTLSNAQIDIIDKLPVPFGLVRFGVAPDHPEVKNVINTFTKVAENARVRFIGNLALGKDVSLQELRNAYNAVILCYGADQDHKLGINDEDTHVISAREIVAWYNGLPECHHTYDKIEQKLRKSETITLIGQGNVAIDVARILLSPIDVLSKTDITSRALATLSECNIQHVHLVGRRGPLQAAFTIKELREMLNLSNVSTVWRKNDFNSIDTQVVSNLARPKKRIIELMLKQTQAECDLSSTNKRFSPIFFRSPKYIEIVDEKKSLQLTVNQLSDRASVIPTNDIETLRTDVILRSIGYKSVNVTHNADLLNFDTGKGIVRNSQGRVHRLIDHHVGGGGGGGGGAGPGDSGTECEPGLYVSGWLGTGPIGVILSTMSNSYLVAKHLCHDIQTKSIDCTTKSGLDLNHHASATTWQDWNNIDKYEIELGLSKGKPREKILNISKMLEISK